MIIEMGTLDYVEWNVISGVNIYNLKVTLNETRKASAYYSGQSWWSIVGT